MAIGACAYPKGLSAHTGNIARGLQFAMFTHHTPKSRNQEFQFIQWFDSPKNQACWAEESGYGPITPATVPDISTKVMKNNPSLAVTLHTLASPYTSSDPGKSGYGVVKKAHAGEWTALIIANDLVHLTGELRKRYQVGVLSNSNSFLANSCDILTLRSYSTSW